MTRIKSIANLLFGKYLLVTNTICSSFLMAVGDAIEQTLPWNKHKNGTKHDWQRTNNMLKVGFCLGPLQHLFYKYIDERYPCRNIRTVLQKILIEQTVASPIYIIAFFVACGVVENKLDKCSSELRNKFVDIYMIDCIVWPPTQFLNFFFFSPQYRMLYVNFTTMIYDIFLSYIKYKDSKT